MQFQTSTTEELTNLTGEQLLFRMDELRHLAAVAGCKWAEANKRFKDLKEMNPSFLAAIQNRLMSEDMKTQDAKIAALASEAYQRRVLEMNDAEYEAELIKVEYRGLVESLKALQSIAFVRNSELRLAR